MQAQIDRQCVIKANAQFWEQMLAMTLAPVPHEAPFLASAGHLLGTVLLSGVWNGSIEVRMGQGLARLATAAMLMQPVESVTDADVLDATREIANMIAGSIKSSLPRPCAMSLPESAAQVTEFQAQTHSEDALAVVFHHTMGDLMVQIWEMACPQ